MAVGRWLYDNPHTQYTLTNAVAAVYMTDWALKYDWRRRLSHMQMTDSDFTVNNWRRRPISFTERTDRKTGATKRPIGTG